MLNPSFASQGSTTLSFEDRHDVFKAIAVGQNGVIIVIENTRIGNSSSVPADFVIAKFDDSGQFSNTFGNEGTVRVSLNDSTNHNIDTLELDDEGRIYIGLTDSLKSHSKDMYQDIILALHWIRPLRINDTLIHKISKALSCHQISDSPGGTPDYCR